MNTATLNDKQLLANTKILVNKESEISVKILDHLAEIERRKLFCDLSYSSLFTYCLGELGFSKQEAFRRIDAMRLAKKMPEVKAGLDKGSLSLTNTNMISSLFKNSEIADDEKVKIVKDVEGMSKKECETKIDKIKDDLGITPTPKSERKNNEQGGGVRLHLSLSKNTAHKLEKLKGLLAHKKNHSTEELLDLMLDNMIEKTEKKKFKSLKKSSPQSSPKTSNKQTRYIDKATKEEVYTKAHGKCENCGSVYALEIDHINNYAKGGSNDSTNLQLLCRACNSRKAIVDYGIKKIESFTLPGKCVTKPKQCELLL
ncbi:MAG: HNH endonuclease [Bacteriovoracaceae bacterium]|nr:HNH endonuclease [Bacteriovoracaceae bacterium]